MNKLQNRKTIVSEINKAAVLYKENLVGNTFMYVFDNRYIEVIFKAQNFKHLTGVASNLSAKRFYAYATKHILTAKQIWFDATHPYDLCLRKIKHLSQIPRLAGSENFMLEEIQAGKKTFKFGTTDLNFTLCMDLEYDNNGNKKSDCYVVESLRDEDCFERCRNAFVVTHILSKRNDQKLYNKILYAEEKSSFSDIPIQALDVMPEKIRHSRPTFLQSVSLNDKLSHAQSVANERNARNTFRYDNSHKKQYSR